MSLLTICPVIVPPRANIVESWTHPDHLVIINGEHDIWHKICAGQPWHVHTDPEQSNVGCPESWNIGFRLAAELGHSHVAILSQSLLVHEGTSRLAEQVDRYADDRGMFTDDSFHCAVFSVALWRRVGGFDTGLPIWCDIDFLRRANALDLYADNRFPGTATPIPHRAIRTTTERNIAARSGAVDPELYAIDEARYHAKWNDEVGA